MSEVRWGPWRLEDLFLVHEPTDYDVSLGRCLSPEAVLDWIVQVAKKSWADHATVGALVEALNDLLDVQAMLCPFAERRTIAESDLPAVIDSVARMRVLGRTFASEEELPE